MPQELLNPFTSSKPQRSSRQEGVLLGEEGIRLRKVVRNGLGSVRPGIRSHGTEQDFSEFASGLDQKESHLQPGEFWLAPSAEHTFPSKDQLLADLPRGYGFKRLYMDDVRECSFSDLGLTDGLLDEMGVVDPILRDELLDVDQDGGDPVVAIMMSTNILLDEARTMKPETESLSTSEILDALDRKGYRPATLKELLAYCKFHWDPRPVEGITPKQFTPSAETIATIGGFVTHDTDRCFMTMAGGKDWRNVSARWIGHAWINGTLLLCVRK